MSAHYCPSASLTFNSHSHSFVFHYIRLLVYLVVFVVSCLTAVETQTGQEKCQFPYLKIKTNAKWDINVQRMPIQRMKCLTYQLIQTSRIFFHFLVGNTILLIKVNSFPGSHYTHLCQQLETNCTAWGIWINKKITGYFYSWISKSICSVI